MQAPSPDTEVRVQLQARGLALTQRARLTVRREVAHFMTQFPGLRARMQVRLFRMPGGPAGLESGCLINARVGRAQMVVVATGIDGRLMPAIRSAFVRLAQGTRAALRSDAVFALPHGDHARPIAT